VRCTRRVSALVTAAALLVASCTTAGTPRPTATTGAESGATTTQVAPGVTVTLPAGTSVAVTGQPAAVNTAALTAPIRLPGSSRSLASPVTVVSPAVQITADGPLPAAGATLSISIPEGSVGPGDLAMLANWDPARSSWVPVTGRWDATSHSVSALVPHFSVWIAFVLHGLGAIVLGALDALFGISATPGMRASCQPAPDLTLAASATGGGPSICAQDDGPGRIVVKVVNDRSYPIDVQSPAAGVVTVDDGGNALDQLGTAITQSIHQGKRLTLLVPRATATITLPVSQGQVGQVGTHLDGEAYLLGILGVGLDEITMIEGKFGRAVKRDLAAFSQAKCAAEITALPADVASVETLRASTTAAVDCLRLVVAENAVGVWADLVALETGLLSAATASIFGLVDSARARTDHVYAITRASTSSPAPSPTVLAVKRLGSFAALAADPCALLTLGQVELLTGKRLKSGSLMSSNDGVTPRNSPGCYFPWAPPDTSGGAGVTCVDLHAHPETLTRSQMYGNVRRRGSKGPYLSWFTIAGNGVGLTVSTRSALCTLWPLPPGVDDNPAPNPTVLAILAARLPL